MSRGVYTGDPLNFSISEWIAKMPPTEIDFDSPAIVWFRNDLRLTANPALDAAARHTSVVPLFIWAPEEEAPWPPGKASQWWLHRSLAALGESLDKRGSRLILDMGSSRQALSKAIEKSGAKSIYWNRRYEPAIIERDRSIKEQFKKQGLHVESFNGSLLNEPWEVLKKDGAPYQVYTAYWRVARTKVARSQSTRSLKLPPPPEAITSYATLADLQLNPTIPWDQGLEKSWTPGEAQARRSLERFMREGVATYDKDRDIPSIIGTSLLSPHLHFGEISPKQIWAAVKKKPTSNPNSQQFLKEVVWRDFAAHLLYHFPHTDEAPLREAFRKFPWKKSKKKLKAWQQGMTGYPIVDAGMRQLWHTGWMHNRVRMIVASFLVKDFRIRWQDGSRWFWDTLVDADLASNTLGWQWTAGCGADAAPYFRVFNPMLQGSRFDPDGRYIRAWVPELSGLPNKWIHAPWEAPDDVLQKASITLGKTYPKPAVDHFDAKEEALQAYDAIKVKK